MIGAPIVFSLLVFTLITKFSNAEEKTENRIIEGAEIFTVVVKGRLMSKKKPIVDTVIRLYSNDSESASSPPSSRTFEKSCSLAERVCKSAQPSPSHAPLCSGGSPSATRVEREHTNNWVVEAAASGFYAARQRYRRRRLSRHSNAGDSGDGPSSSGTSGSPIVPRRIVSKHSGRALQLDDEQCEQLSDAFFQIPDKYYAFEQMFLRLFTRDDPEIALVFGLQGIPEVELRRRTPFRTHVCKFQRFMTTVMDLLTKKSREEELIQIIRMVGRQHCNVKQLSFTASRWLSFKGALLSTFAKKETDKFYVSWTILISFLIYEIKDAFLSHIRHLRSSSLPQVLETYKLEFRRRTPTATTDTSTENITIIGANDPAFYRPPCRVLICLSGKRKSGKDFFAARLREQLGSLVLDALQLNDLIVSVDVVGVSFSLKDQYARLNGLDAQRLRDDSDYKETVRSEMVEYGERIRQKDPGFFCREALRRVVPLVDDSIQLASTSHLDGGLQIIIVSDCRRPSDLAYFRKVSAYNFDPERELSTPEADADDEYDARCDFSAPTQRTSILPILVRINADEGTRRARGLRFVAGIDDAPTECALDGDDVPWDVCVHNDGDSPLNEAIRRIATLCAKRISLVSNASMHSSGSSL